MASHRSKNPAITPLELTGKGFDGAVVYLFPYEIKACQRAVTEGSLKDRYREESEGIENAIKYDSFRKLSDALLYIQWFKAQICKELVFNTDVILKKLAAMAAVDGTDVVDFKTGLVKDLKDLPELVLGQLEMSWEYDSKGKAQKVKVALPKYKDVLGMLTQVSSVDNELVKTLLAKVAQPEVVVKKQ